MTNQQIFSLCFFCLPVIPQDDESLARLVPLLILNFVLFSFLIALLFFFSSTRCFTYPPAFSQEKRDWLVGENSVLMTKMTKRVNVAMQTHKLLQPPTRENHPTRERRDAAVRMILPTASRLSRVRWFSRALAFRSLYFPWGKMGTTRSLIQYQISRALDTNFTCDELNESYSVAH